MSGRQHPVVRDRAVARSVESLPTRHVAGFTLIEVLVAIALFSVVLTLLLGGFRFISRAWDAGEGAVERAMALRITQRTFDTMLQRSRPLTLKDGDERRFAFTGDDRHLRFVAALPPYPGRAGLYTVELFITSRQEKRQLWLRQTPFDANAFFADAAQLQEDTLLLETDQHPIFDYLPVSDDGGEPSWQAQWDEKLQLPQQVRLSFGGQTGWPDIISTLAIDSDLACLLPKLGGICRNRRGRQ